MEKTPLFTTIYEKHLLPFSAHFFLRGLCKHKLVVFSFNGRYIQFVVPGSQIKRLDILYNSDDDMTELYHQCPTKSTPGMPGQEAVTFFDEVSISPTMQTEIYSQLL